MYLCPRSTLAFSLAVALCCSISHAQWSSDSTLHQVIADGVGEQVQPKLSPTVDGSVFASWYSSDGGYDVYLQRLDAQGNPLWGDNGNLIADRNFSSTQDYDLDTDIDGFAVLTYRDNSSGSVLIGVQRVSPSGELMWGPGGVQLGIASELNASPDVATTSDGCSVIGWSSDATIRLAKLDTTGDVLWEHEIGEPGQTLILSAMHGVGDGRVVLSWVQFEFFLGAKTLHAQMLDVDGNEVWAQRTVVFGNGSLQFGNFPEFVPSADGTTTFSWYDTANALQVFAQRLGTDGTALYGPNGVAVSIAPRERVSPSVAYDQATDTTFVSWVELANNQGDQGVYAQALDNKGTRLWGDSGVQISPTDGNASGSINTRVLDNDLVTLWIEGTGGFASDVVNATRLDAAGGAVWSTQVASDPAQRARLTTTNSSDGFIVAAWQIGDFGVADIESHNLNPDGTLGASAGCPADITGDGKLDFFDISDFLSAFNNQLPDGDFNDDGLFDFFDTSDFLSAFNAGCP